MYGLLVLVSDNFIGFVLDSENIRKVGVAIDYWNPESINIGNMYFKFIIVVSMVTQHHLLSGTVEPLCG